MKNTKTRRTGRAWAAGALLAASITAAHAAPQPAAGPQPIGPKLTQRLHQMLIEEMQNVKQSMRQILDGLTVGDHSLVMNMAEQIHGSFILARQLTEQDKKDLMKAASPEFLKLDSEFHVTAKKLGDAAKNKDFELQRFYYAKLVDSCQNCHAQFVTDRFPAFSGAQPEHVH